MPGQRLPALRAVAAALVALCPAASRASGDAGFIVSLGSFQLRATCGDAVEYPDRADLAIRDPRRALFTVATTLQANATRFRAIRHSVTAEVYRRMGESGSRLAITEDPASRSVVLADVALGSEDVERLIVAVLCRRYAGACRAPPARRLTLHRCGGDPCPGQILFGAIPSDVANREYALLPQPRSRARAVRVSAAGMRRHYPLLE